MGEPECRRCSDCIGCEHHWVEEATYAPEDFARDFEPIADHVCKHCPKIGLTCPECDGTGECPVCDGEGVSEDDHDADGECSACDGYGECASCDGCGVIAVDRESDV